MQKYNIYFSWATLIVLLMNIQSCQMEPCGSSPSDLIENMEDLVKDAKKMNYKPKDDRWKPYDDRFDTYFEECFDRWSPEMTGNQKREFAGLVTRYIGNRFGRSIFKSIFGSGEPDDAESAEFFEKLGEDLQELLEENRKSGTDFLEDLKKEIADKFNK